MNNNGYKHFGDFVDNLSRFSDRLAITSKPFIKIERLNYGELQKLAYRSANFLASLGLKSGQKIMIISPNCPQWTALLLGAQLSGITVIPVDMRSNLETVNNYLRQTDPELIFRSKYLLSALDKIGKTHILEELFEEMEGISSSLPKVSLTGNETAVIVFTSGTTADPKGVVLSQKNILTNVYGVQQALTIEPSWRFLSVLPLSHMYELTGGCLVPLSSGASIFYLTKVSPLAIARALQDYEITTILAVPQLVILFLQRIRQVAKQQGRARILENLLHTSSIIPFKARRILFHSVHKNLGGHLDIVVTGGAPIPREVSWAWERMGVRMVQGYGLTETSPVLTFNRPDNRRLDSQGQPLENIKLRISPEDREIQAKGPSVFSHYLDNKKATEDAFTKDGWFKTGDIGKLDNNWLQIQGRAKFAIVLSSGLKVFPEDIEVAAEHLTKDSQICIVGFKRPDGEEVRAVVVSKESDQNIDKLIYSINSKLESFQHISSWVRWPDADFPRTRLLKIDRKSVQEWANSQSENNARDNNKSDQNDDDQLINILRLVLNKPRMLIKEKDSLSDLGLDSLRRLAVVSLVEEQLGISIPETSLNQSTSVSEFRKIVEQGKPAEPPTPRSTWAFNPIIRFFGNITRESLIRGILKIWVSEKVTGRDNIKDLNRPALYIFNHVDNFDALVIFQALPWKIRTKLAAATAADVLKKHRLLALLSRFNYAGFDFSRTEPFMPSLEYVAKLADQGWNIALAPEGKISKFGKLLPFKSGIGLLAVELGLPVVVIKTEGLYGTAPLHSKWPKKHSKVTVKISEPIYFTKNTSYDFATKDLEKKMQNL